MVREIKFGTVTLTRSSLCSPNLSLTSQEREMKKFVMLTGVKHLLYAMKSFRVRSFAALRMTFFLVFCQLRVPMSPKMEQSLSSQ